MEKSDINFYKKNPLKENDILSLKSKYSSKKFSFYSINLLFQILIIAYSYSFFSFFNYYACFTLTYLTVTILFLPTTYIAMFLAEKIHNFNDLEITGVSSKDINFKVFNSKALNYFEGELDITIEKEESKELLCSVKRNNRSLCFFEVEIIRLIENH